jgi:ParB/RepB/Spo0J family partition protein
MAEVLDEIECVAPAELIPYSNNAKEHPEEQVKKIASSIKNYGWDQPIVVDSENEIIKGHGRLQAAELLGLDEVPVIKREDLTDAEAKASRIADNKTAESPWNNDLLASELEILEQTDSIAMDTLGFDDTEIDDLLEPEDMEIPDGFDEVDDEAIETEHECPECGYEW